MRKTEKNAVCEYVPSDVRATCCVCRTVGRDVPAIGDRSASTSARPCIEAGTGSPNILRNVGAKSMFPLGVVTEGPCLMSGPAAPFGREIGSILCARQN